jgi:choice-of-anchor C domain-containing protein
MAINSALSLAYDQLSNFAGLENFWNLFDTAFGTQYDYLTAFTLKSQWQSHDFSSFPQIEVVSSDVLGTANGAYAISTNKIYLSDTFVETASQQSLEAVILEEYGHFVDAQVNQTDTAGDEGELFSAIVRSVNLSAAELSRIKTEDDHAVVMIDGQAMAIEMANGQVNLITNGSFEVGPDIYFGYVPLDPGSTALTGWTVTRAQIDYVAFWADADGDFSLDLSGTPGVGGIAQAFNTVVGQQYLVSFALAGNPEGGTPIKQLGVSAAGQSEVFSFDTTGFSIDNMGWVNKTLIFTATASTTTLEFYSLSIEPENYFNGPTLDNVCVVSWLPSITLAVAPTSVNEDGTTNLVYNFTRTGPTTSALTVNYSIAGTANATDYTGATPGTGKTITFAANSATATLTIDPTADTTIESNETVALTLATGTGYVIGTTAAVTGTITNDDLPSITLAVVPTSVTEDGTTNLVYTFTRTGPTTSTLTVNYGITGTADATDYTGATPGTGKTITFAANSATATLTIDPTADTTIEANDTVALTLATGTGYTVGTTTAVTGTITDDDTPSISLALNYGGISENSPSNFIYTFTRTGSTTNALTVNYGITGTTDATDYTGATPGAGKTIVFSAGAATATLALDSIGDTSVETDETISLQLATGTGYTVGTSAAQIATIINDDGTRRQKGTNGKDVILGTNLGDILSGGLGNDTLAGSDGGDSFLFNATNEGIDTITDFSVGSDYLLIKGSAFGGGLVSGDTITSAQFIIGTAATNASQRFIYNATNGALFFDVDGNGATSAIQFATLSPKLGLTFEDIFIS